MLSSDCGQRNTIRAYKEMTSSLLLRISVRPCALLFIVKTFPLYSHILVAINGGKTSSSKKGKKHGTLEKGIVDMRCSTWL